MSNEYLELQDALWKWMTAVVPPYVTVFWDKPNVPRPPEPYISMMTPLVGAGTGDDSIERLSDLDSDDGKYIIGGQRKCTLYVVAYGPSAAQQQDGVKSAYQILLDAADSLQNPLVLGSLRTDGLAVWGPRPRVVEIAQLLETGFQDRASMDLIFGYAHNMEVDLGTIRKVTGEGTLEGKLSGPVDLDIES